MNELRGDLAKAEREAFLDRAAEIKYGKIPQTENQIKNLESQLR